MSEHNSLSSSNLICEGLRTLPGPCLYRWAHLLRPTLKLKPLMFKFKSNFLKKLPDLLVSCKINTVLV